MNKQEFLDELQKGLSGLPENDIEERLAFYGEMIDDRIEEGLSQEEAVSQFGPVEDVTAQIIAETPLPRIVKERVRPKRSLRAWEIVLIVLGSPIWLALVIAAIAVIIAVYAVLWAVLICLWAVEAALIASVPGGLLAGLYFIFNGNVRTGLACIGAGIACAGLSIFMFFGCRAASKGIIVLTKKIAHGIKSIFVGREKNK